MAAPAPAADCLGHEQEQYTKYTKEIALRKLQAKGLTTGTLSQRLCVHVLMRGGWRDC
eukprot:gene14317-34325_t